MISTAPGTEIGDRCALRGENRRMERDEKWGVISYLFHPSALTRRHGESGRAGRLIFS
jgi:hypothetical protein